MSPSHVLALMLSENLLAPVASTPLGEPLAELRRRLSATLTPAARAYCEELKGTVVATTFAPGDLARHGHAIERIEEAIHRQHRLALRYRAPRKALEDRRVDPYCTWYHSGGLYLVAWCHKAVDIRTFNVQRIESAVVLDEAFEPDPRFDADAFTRLGFGVLHGPVHHVVIEFTDEVAHLVRERLVHHTQRIHELADGGIRFSIDAAGLPEIARWVAGFGSEARPVAPPELIDAVRHIHERGLAMCQARS